jgi:ankyrin repeat protein
MNNQEEQKLYEEYKNLPEEVLNDIFLGACYQGNLELAKFVLTYPSLKNHANIHANDDLSLNHACSEGHLEIVKYLLSSSDLKEHIDIHSDNDIAFRVACSCEQLEVIKYFIFDYNINETKHIKNYLKRKPNEKVENMFKIREVNKNLEKDLSTNQKNENKIKL